MSEPRERKADSNPEMDGFEKDFEMYAGWLKQRPATRPLPDFDPAWLEKNPRTQLSQREQAEILGSAGSDRYLQWGMLAAVLLLAIGGSVLYPRFFPAAVPGVVEKAGDPVRAMAMFVQGEAKIKVPTQAEPVALTSGTVLEEGTLVETGPGARVDLAFSKGSIIRINENSSLFVETMRRKEGANQVELDLKNGSVLSVVERLSAGDDYSVTTPTAIAGVRGTSFRVSTDGTRTEVTCQDGSLAVNRRGESGKERVLSAKQQVSITRETTSPVRAHELLAAEEQETNDLRERLAAFDPEIVDATLKLEKVKSEADIERVYHSGLATITLRDGRSLRGIVASQFDDRLIIQTPTGQLVISTEQVKNITMDN